MIGLKDNPEAMAEPAAAVEKRAVHYHDRAVAYARALRRPPFHAETVHRLRTHLRRLQAYAEFLQRPAAAAAFAESVSWLSRLRMLDVFLRFLRRRRGDTGDLRRVAWALQEEEMMVAHAGHLDAIRAVLARTTIVRMRRPAAFLSANLAALDRNRADRLDAALRGLSPKAKRKELHRLRLLVKALRYQEEIALETTWGNSLAIAALRRLQRTLGDYCDRDQFRRLAKKMRLACRGEMAREYRRHRERARLAVRKLEQPQICTSGLR